jgi:hypothetical protein
MHPVQEGRVMIALEYSVPEGSTPRWANAEGTQIDIDVFFPHLGLTVPYTAAQSDPGYPHSEEIFERAAAGEFGPITPYVPPAPTAVDIIAERDRRLALGFDYDFGDARGVHRIGTTPADMTGWDEVTKGAQAALSLGQPTFAIQLVTDTGPVTVTALEWQAVLAAATAHRQPIWAASFALQAMNPIPADYADDARWPASGGGG